MRPRTVFLFLSLLATVLAVACVGAPAAPPSPSTAAVGFPMTVVDDAGRRVEIPAPPRRIVSIAPSNTEILFALGLGDRVVAVDQYSNYPPEARTKTQLGSYLKPDLEQLVAAAPDLVIGTSVHLKAVVPDLESRRVPVVVLDAKSLDDVLDRIGRVGRFTGEERRAAELVGALRGRADAVAAVTAGVAGRPRVFFELSPQLHTAGPGSFVDDLIRRAGGENVAGDAGAQWPQINQEVVLQRNPDVVLVAHADAVDPLAVLRARPGWAGVGAVQAGRVHAIDPDVVTRAGPRIVDGLEVIARAVHPDRSLRG